MSPAALRALASRVARTKPGPKLEAERARIRAALGSGPRGTPDSWFTRALHTLAVTPISAGCPDVEAALVPLALTLEDLARVGAALGKGARSPRLQRAARRSA